MSEHHGPFWSIFQDLKRGSISRREFIRKATALGVGLPVTLFVLNAVKVDGAAAPAAAADHPSEGTEGQTRGAGGELKLLQWQAPTVLSQHVATGTKDQIASALVSEPLLSYLPDGSLVPTLAAAVPSKENGGLSPDLTTVTYKLKPGVTWSDGTPFTSADVAFTWQWIVDPANQSVDATTYGVIKSIDTPDDLTAVITFKSPQLGWYLTFAGGYKGAVYPKHILEGGPEKHNAFVKNPTGTGPYKVDSFKENDQVVYSANEKYREPNKPFFATVNLKGGGDATSAAQAVLQTGDWDFAWNLQVEPQLLTKMQEGGKGTVETASPSSPERVLINFTDPNKEVDGQRSELHTPHPFFSDKAVRQALALGADRQTMATQFYLGGDKEPPAANILTGVTPALASKGTSFEYNLDKANQMLDAAGWVKNGDVRAKDGVELKVTYSTTINSVRQKNQAVNKQNWEKLGFKVQLKQVDAGIFFDSSIGNDQNAKHFYSDLLMYTDGPTDAFPLAYMQNWYGGKDAANIAQKSNGWSGVNVHRYNNPEYDALYDSVLTLTDAEKAAEAFVKMNDIVVNDIVVIPLVARAAEKYAILKTLRNANVAGSLFEALYWNIANWNRTA
ncbi:MAG: peptide ABC transporter substrate-binding protein [Thermomicrobiales bacterium]